MSSPLENDYHLVHFQNVQWGDMDAYGHVNNTVYFRYFEDARMDYFEQAGVSEYMDAHNIGPIVAATNCNFRAPLKHPDRIHIAARATIIAPKKINMEYAVYSEQLSAIVAEGEALVIYYDYSVRKSCEVPDTIREAIHRIVGQAS